MTTHSLSAVINQTTDEGFRAWYEIVRDGLVAVGWTQTADTGQLDPVTMIRPAVNTAAGYEIWQSPDGSLIAKLEPGCGSNTSTPQMWMTFGKSTNGAGTLTGQTSTRNTVFIGTTPTSTSTAFTTYFSGSNDHLGVIFWAFSTASGSRHQGFILAGKTVDADGVATTIGFGVARQSSLSGAMSFQSVRSDAPAATLAESNFFSLVPGNVTASLTATDNNQVYLWMMNVPDVLPFLWAGTVLKTELPFGTSISTNLVGQLPRTYMCCSTALGELNLSPANSSSSYGFAILWE